MGTDSNGLDGEIQSIGDLLTQRQRKRFKAGDTLLGRYRILGELGQGGMGLVFRCMDEIGGIEVAVKMLPPEVSHDSGEMEDVRENFRLVSSLVHQNICAVRTLEKDPATGEYFLVMELAQGVNLRQWRKSEVRGRSSEVGGSDGRDAAPRRPGFGSAVGAPAGRAGSAGPSGASYNGIPLEQILPIVRQIAAALDYAHAHKVIHRDIKPSNVMVDTSAFGLQSSACTVKVLDFGLAAQIHTSFSRVSHVRYGTSGTGPYMAPEQWEGQYQDAATDQYALAVLTYELLTGHCPFENHETTVLRESVLKSAPKSPPNLAPAAWDVLKRGLAKERKARFASCTDFAAALGGDKISPQRTQRAQRTGGGWKWAAAVVMLAGLAVAGMLFLGRDGALRRPGSDDGAGTPSSRETVVESGDPAALAVGQGDDLAGSESETAPGSTPWATGDGQPPITPAVFGWVEIQSSPAGATIWIGTNTFPAGREVRLPAGEHKAVAKLAGYYDATVKVTVSDTHIEKADVALSPHRGSAKLSSTPSRARIWLGDRDLGLDTPEIVPNLSIGRQVFTLKKEGYRDGTAEAVVKVDDVVEASGTLEKRQGWLWIKAEGLDGKTVGTLTIGPQKFERATLPKGSLPLVPGLVEVEYRAANGQAARKSAPVEDGKTNNVVLVFGTGSQEGADLEVADLGMKFKWIPAGSFTMGSPTGESGRSGDESPQHAVRFAQGFWMGQTEVTQAQYARVMGGKNPSHWKGANLPVENVSWNDAQKFCQEASRILGKEVRLPSEAEWEYACRAGTTTPFHYGESLDATMANFDGNYPYGNGRKGEYRNQTTPVRTFDANAWGLYDMHGNVWEWCEDWYHDTYNGAPSDGTPWLSPAGSLRVLRGGSWDYYAGYCRSAYRNRYSPVNANFPYGFRVVLSR